MSIWLEQHAEDAAHISGKTAQGHILKYIGGHQKLVTKTPMDQVVHNI